MNRENKKASSQEMMRLKRERKRERERERERERKSSTYQVGPVLRS